MTLPFRLVVASLLFLFAAGNAVVAADPRKQPNLVLILADDLGYECLGCNGGTSYKTPDAEAAAARKKLQEALDKYRDARPAKYERLKPDGKLSGRRRCGASTSPKEASRKRRD